MGLRPSDVTISCERLMFDDETLLRMYKSLHCQIAEKEKQLITSRTNKNNYLHYTISRLAYGFAKEEYETVLSEMKIRGLTA